MTAVVDASPHAASARRRRPGGGAGSARPGWEAMMTTGWVERPPSIAAAAADHSQHGSPSSSPLVRPSPSESASHRARVQMKPALAKD